MIDIHHHLLHGLDDGADSLETSIAMARIAAEDGITQVVCTPHANGQYTYDVAIVEAKLTELRASLAAEKIDLTLGRGCDFHLSYDNIQEALADPARYSINGLGYLMVELPDYGLPRNLIDTFYELRLAGLTPVLTHPERNPTLIGGDKENALLKDWLRGGLLLQVTADSITGRMGKPAERFARHLLDNRWVNFVATDAHNLRSRPPRLSTAYESVVKHQGAEYAHMLFVTNPKAASDGAPLAEQEEPLKLFNQQNDPPWWKRLLLQR